MEHLLSSIRKQCSAWKIYHKSESISKLRKCSCTKNKKFSAHADLTIFLDMSTKLVTLNVSTPSSIIEEKFSDYSIMKKIDYNNVKCDGLKHTHEIVAFIHKIETENSFVNLCEINPPNHLDVSSSLLELAKVEDNDNKNELAVYYNFLSEQIVMINTTFNKRVYPADSFTIACGLLLHNNSTSRYENIRKALSFILLPEKRNFFDINKKAAIPQDCFFNEKKQLHIAIF